jgi:hypothetical protein
MCIVYKAFLCVKKSFGYQVTVIFDNICFILDLKECIYYDYFLNFSHINLTESYDGRLSQYWDPYCLWIKP